MSRESQAPREEYRPAEPSSEEKTVVSDVHERFDPVELSGEREPADHAKKEDDGLDLVERYLPAYIARGGEHMVFEPRGKEGERAKRDVVAKVDARWLRFAVDPPKVLDEVPDELKKKYVKERLQGSMLAHRQRFARMKEYFGTGNVVVQKEYVMDVPLTRKMVEETLGEEGKAFAEMVSEEGIEVPAIIRVQRRAEELDDPDHRSVVSGYAEHADTIPTEKYAMVTDAFLEGKNVPDAIETFAEVVPKEFADLLERAKEDEGLRRALGDFADKAVNYTLTTGEMLDLAGRDNVVLAKGEDGTWKYRLLDALAPENELVTQNRTMLQVAREAARHAAEGKKVGNDERIVLLNAVNYARAVNALSKTFGSGAAINLVDPENVGKVDWKELLKDVK